eukprot:TRINITY_DN33930_c0_g1_i1.p1 TRINITY_DN33930_c0_g1~~TRINITY_DN33930_c0_g1_i1.p1  ORF type:complete len:115 (+),score=26.91 TRINITY_DN33930_c0_g1_i1:168-512(+)
MCIRDSIYAYVSGGCMGVGSFKSGHEDGFYNNKCIMQRPGSYASFDCQSPALPKMYNNSVFNPTGANFSECGKTLAEWQRLNHDQGTTVAPWPADEQVLLWAQAALHMPSNKPN